MNVEEDNNKNSRKLSEELEALIEENQKINKILNTKIEELKQVRIKELEMTLKIYQLEELYLKKIKYKLIYG